MGIFTTKDPDKAALKLTTTDPSKGFGAGRLFESKPDDQLTDEQKELRYRSGAMQQPAPAMKCGGKVKKMASGGSVRGTGCAKRGVKKCKVC